MKPGQIDRPEVVAEVTRLFHDYEHALMSNEVESLLEHFWHDPRLTRYGIADRQLGIDEMIAFRRATPAPNFTRRLENLRITAFGDDVAIAQVEFIRTDTALRGFQTQTWVRLDLGGEACWKIASAHVSMIPFEA